MKFTPPKDVHILAKFMAQVSKFFWENKSKFVVQKKNLGEKKQKWQKYLGLKFEKGQCWAILKISFFLYDLLRFSRVIFFIFSVFFWKNYFCLVVVLDFWLNIFLPKKSITSEFMSLYAINKTNRKPLNIPISSTLS